MSNRFVYRAWDKKIWGNFCLKIRKIKWFQKHLIFTALVRNVRHGLSNLTFLVRKPEIWFRKYISPKGEREVWAQHRNMLNQTREMSAEQHNILI